jgi:PhnB protein
MLNYCFVNIEQDNSQPWTILSVQAQGVFPMISYENGIEAMEWLSRVFGFREHKRIVEGERLSHGEMETGAGLVMLASPSHEYEGPIRHLGHCEAARRWSEVPWIIDGVLVLVDDVEAHYKRSKSEGAHILSDIQPGPPGRLYRAQDVEGHRWMFMQRT